MDNYAPLNIMPHPIKWYRYYKVKVHRVDECHQLKRDMEPLIQKGYLKKYVQGNSQ